MAKRGGKRTSKAANTESEAGDNQKGDDPERSANDLGDAEGDTEDPILEDTLVCRLTGEQLPAKPEERTLQSVIEQLHREYRVELSDMARDLRISCENEDGKRKSRAVSLVVYESSKPHENENIIRVVMVSKPGTKAEPKGGGKGETKIDALKSVLENVATERKEIYGLWTNGLDLAFFLRRYLPRTGEPECIPLTDFPAPDETLDDLNNADRRPLRIAAGDSLLRTFKHCHDYIYGNQSMAEDKAFWQILYLVFTKIYDEQESKRKFFVGATERNTEEGVKKIAGRIRSLFKEAKKRYDDVFTGSEEIELEDRKLAYVAAQFSRFDLLATDTDAKGMAYEAITSKTLKQKRGQFFTPRNVIRMIVEMLAPAPGQLVLDPACGSGGFLVVAMTCIRLHFLRQMQCPFPEYPLPSELMAVKPSVRSYARDCLFGIDVDTDLRKAARMNMVMNGDGHGHIFSFNSLEYGVYRSPEMETLEAALHVGPGEAFGKFDYVFTNPPFGAKIPVEDSAVLSSFDLGHSWTRSGDTWVKGNRQKKVPPEILFIEACWKFLKPGTGMMGIVLPNGILGNPGTQMEFVRYWILKHCELLASVDLPAEAFMPQVSVQASCVLLRRRSADELRLQGKKGAAQRPVFMAIAEQCGHGRRGEPRYERNPDGTDVIAVKDYPERWERDGQRIEKQRVQAEKVLADDLPEISREYRRHRNEVRRK